MYYVWGTRMLNGEFTYEFAIFPFQGGRGERPTSIAAPLQYSFPPVSLAMDSGAGQLGTEFAPFKIDSPNVILSALYTQEGQVIARMYEHGGEQGSLQLDYTHGSARLLEVDLAGNERQELAPPLKFRPWQIRTIKLEIPQR